MCFWEFLLAKLIEKKQNEPKYRFSGIEWCAMLRKYHITQVSEFDFVSRVWSVGYDDDVVDV